MRHLIACSCLLAPLASCGTLSGPPTLSTNAAVLTHYMFRGVVQHERGVAQLDATASVQTESGLVLSGTTWVNLDLDDDPGAGTLPSGNGGELSEIDVVGDVAFQVGPVSASAGLANYNFPNLVGRSTTELYAGASLPNVPLTPALSLYWDVDQVGGLYALLSGGHSLNLGGGWTGSLGASLGWADGDQAASYFGASGGGLADLTLSIGADRNLGSHGSVGVALNGSTILESALEDGLEASGIDPDVVWLSLAYSWSL